MDQSYGAVVYAGPPGRPRFLLVQTARGGHWGFPKGHPAPRETPDDTTRREVREESGCEIELVAGFEEELRYPLPGGSTKCVILRLAVLTREHPIALPNDEISAVRWLPFRQARDLVTFPNCRDVLTRAHRFLRRAGRNDAGVAPFGPEP